MAKKRTKPKELTEAQIARAERKHEAQIWGLLEKAKLVGLKVIPPRAYGEGAYLEADDGSLFSLRLQYQD